MVSTFSIIGIHCEWRFLEDGFRSSFPVPLHGPNAVWAKRGNAPKQKIDALSEFSRILQAIVCEMYPSLESFSDLFWSEI